MGGWVGGVLQSGTRQTLDRLYKACYKPLDPCPSPPPLLPLSSPSPPPLLSLSYPPSPAEASSERFGNTWASVVVKMVSAYLCYALYIWTMIAPLVLGRCRDFNYTDE